MEAVPAGRNVELVQAEKGQDTGVFGRDLSACSFCRKEKGRHPEHSGNRLTSLLLRGDARDHHRGPTQAASYSQDAGSKKQGAYVYFHSLFSLALPTLSAF